ncbi:hypothetical protein DVH24_015892 [Malus domestica]|uniref:Nodulin homeobox homeobox-like domain-containing protein n=1 Tax=Malus domestica TaxID=3750 RepID=A0A498JG41_MALDO|nr:hypothetical protein DVH24_015892 [Malus domestica]
MCTLEGQSTGGCAPPLLSKQRSNLNNRSANLEEMSENSGFQDVDQVDVREGKGLSGNASLDVLGCTKEMLIMLKQVVQTQAQQEEKMLGSEVTCAQLKNWLNNREARLARTAKDVCATPEADNALPDKQGGRGQRSNISPDSPGRDASTQLNVRSDP